MGTKKKKAKKEGETKKEVEIVIPNFIPKDLKPMPLYVKIKHMKDIYFIYTDEYEYGLNIKERLSKIINIPPENIRLHLGNKRQIENDSTNHDQQVKNATVLYASFKTGEGNNDWENYKEIIDFKDAEEEEKKEEEKKAP